jgi:hypothetical protein
MYENFLCHRLQRPCRKRRALESPTRSQRQSSDENPLDLIQPDGIIGAIIELGRARRFVIRNLEPTAPYGLCMFNYTTVRQVGGDAGGPEGMATGCLRQFGLPCAPLDHPAPADTASGCRCSQHLQPVETAASGRSGGNGVGRKN